MNPQSPFAIANYFIRKAAETGVTLTPMKLIKLVYIAHGWYLGLAGKPLLREPVEAWQYGPVIESLYHAFKRYGNTPIPPSADTGAVISDNEHRDITRLLDKVWEKYSRLTAAQLSTITHQPNTPWTQVYNPNGINVIIPDDIIRKHYQDKIDAGRKRTTPAAFEGR
jgi:uncharacterized phage-associated protein